MRETGLYWVKYKGDLTIAYYSVDTGYWSLTGSDMSFDDKDFEWISDERIAEPDVAVIDAGTLGRNALLDAARVGGGLGTCDED